MDKKSKDKLMGILIVPIGLTLVLIPFSMLIGWNLITLFLFWFVLAPGLIIYLPRFISSNENHLVESVVGLIIFYGIVVFTIYDHYKTDFFQVMILSCLTNLILVSIITWDRRPRTQIQ